MRRLILAWILVAVSAIGCAQYAEIKPVIRTTFEVACEALEERYVSRISCEASNLTAPIIVKSHVVAPRYLGFYYHGEPYIFVRWDLSPDRTRAVVVHETVHYIIDHLGILVSRCDGEELARTITAEYMGKPVDPTWKDRYGCDLWSTGSVQW